MQIYCLSEWVVSLVVELVFQAISILFEGRIISILDVFLAWLWTRCLKRI